MKKTIYITFLLCTAYSYPSESITPVPTTPPSIAKETNLAYYPLFAAIFLSEGFYFLPKNTKSIINDEVEALEGKKFMKKALCAVSCGLFSLSSMAGAYYLAQETIKRSLHIIKNFYSKPKLLDRIKNGINADNISYIFSGKFLAKSNVIISIVSFVCYILFRQVVQTSVFEKKKTKKNNVPNNIIYNFTPPE